jgi:hypothetical protein
MTDLRLTMKKRAFPSQGRIRLHESSLTGLKIVQGDSVDLVNEGNGRAVTVTVIADWMVGTGEIRVSAEDIKALGLTDGNDVVVRKTQPLNEKARVAAKDANRMLSESVDKLDLVVQKTIADVKTEGAKAANAFRAGAKTAADSVKSVARKTADRVASDTRAAPDTARATADTTADALKEDMKVVSDTVVSGAGKATDAIRAGTRKIPGADIPGPGKPAATEEKPERVRKTGGAGAKARTQKTSGPGKTSTSKSSGSKNVTPEKTSAAKSVTRKASDTGKSTPSKSSGTRKISGTGKKTGDNGPAAAKKKSGGKK